MKSAREDQLTAVEDIGSTDLGEDFDESEESFHPDERWLVSYADMMTLLFGFFVLLYAMSDKFDLVQKSASKEFNTPSVATVKNGAAEDIVAKKGDLEFAALLEERRLMLIKATDLEMQLKRETEKSALAAKTTASADELKEIIRRQKGQLDQSKQVERENMNLRAQLVLKDLPPNQDHGANGANAKMTLTAMANLPGGGIFSTRVLKISLSGLQVQDIPPESLGSTFKISLRREDGANVDVMTYLVTTDGQRTHRLAITDFPNGDEQVLRDWFAQK